MKVVSLPGFLTPKQLEEAARLRTAAAICEGVIKPNIAEINRKLGQENDPMYLAYVCEYVIGIIDLGYRFYLEDEKTI